MGDFAAYDKIHNQSIEIKKLKEEIDRAKKAYRRLEVSRSVERKSHEDQLRKERRLMLFYKRKFMLLAFGTKYQTFITEKES